MYTHPEWIRQGIGSFVLRLAEDASKEMGFDRCELMATLSGILLYEKKGYKVEEEIGDLLFSVVNLIRHLNLNPDTVVEKSIKKFKNRFLNIEKTLQKNNIKINSKNINQLWNEAKI